MDAAAWPRAGGRWPGRLSALQRLFQAVLLGRPLRLALALLALLRLFEPCHGLLVLVEGEAQLFVLALHIEQRLLQRHALPIEARPHLGQLFRDGQGRRGRRLPMHDEPEPTAQQQRQDRMAPRPLQELRQKEGH